MYLLCLKALLWPIFKTMPFVVCLVWLWRFFASCHISFITWCSLFHCGPAKTGFFFFSQHGICPCYVKVEPYDVLHVPWMIWISMRQGCLYLFFIFFCRNCSFLLSSTFTTLKKKKKCVRNFSILQSHTWSTAWKILRKAEFVLQLHFRPEWCSALAEVS